MPDILVSDRDGLHDALAVEVKTSTEDIAATERRLERYMVGMRCPVGLLVTPDVLRIYRDTYRVDEVSSVECVGEFSSAGLFGRAVEANARANTAATRGVYLEDVVQAWLEMLTSPSATSQLPQPLRQAIEEHVLPALIEGEVRAALPRLRQTGS